MSNRFREFVRKIGSGPHTGKNLTREESHEAMIMMLEQTATPAQIGAFLIAHRIKRPTGIELAGMLDAYAELGPQLQPVSHHQRRPVILGIPYDGRDRTAPLSPLIALILTSVGVPVILHGGDRTPTKYGVSLSEIYQEWGLDWTKLTFNQTQEIFAETGLAFVYTPNHFPLSAALVTYRDQIGKRPPLASLELIWCPYSGDSHLICGFVHPPTENFILEALELRQNPHYITTIKGLEGSCDLPRDRTAIIGQISPNEPLSRIFLHHQDYGFSNQNFPILPTNDLVKEYDCIINNQYSLMLDSILWNSGFYLWHCGISETMEEGINVTKEILADGLVSEQKLKIYHKILSFNS